MKKGLFGFPGSPFLVLPFSTVAKVRSFTNIKAWFLEHLALIS
jgi:hypothetical protein